ncbi:uncharacterized protein [Argopecten irradians]|uniref:uncharacterized protein n=1 Tax=Argopecten irradians TaxID=31199 RepID=UPI003720B344
MAGTKTNEWNAKEKDRHEQSKKLIRTNAEDGRKDSSLHTFDTPVKCLILATLLSIALIVSQMVCIVLTVQTIQDSDVPITAEVYRGDLTELPLISCNRSTRCTWLKDDLFAKLVLLFSGVRHQSLKRRRNMGKQPYMHIENCDQFALQNCSNDTLKWSNDLNRHRRMTNGSITVTESSLYGLNSIFTFQWNSTSLNTSREERSSQSKHSLRIERKSHKDSMILFEKNVALSKENKFKTSTIFDFVYLQAGDRVYPSLSDTSSLYSVHQANVWGIFPIR